MESGLYRTFLSPVWATRAARAPTRGHWHGFGAPNSYVERVEIQLRYRPLPPFVRGDTRIHRARGLSKNFYPTFGHCLPKTGWSRKNGDSLHGWRTFARCFPEIAPRSSTFFPSDEGELWNKWCAQMCRLDVSVVLVGQKYVGLSLPRRLWSRPDSLCVGFRIRSFAISDFDWRESYGKTT